MTEGGTPNSRDADFLSQSAEHDLRTAVRVLDDVSDGVVVWDLTSGKRLYVNRAVLGVVGATADEVAAAPFGAFARPDETDQIRTELDAMATGRVTETRLEVHVRDRDGEEHPLELQIWYLPPVGPDDHAKAVFRFRDVSERVQAERRWRATEALLQEVFERSAVAMALVRDGGHRRQLLQANDALCRLLGRSADELCDAILDDFLVDEPNSARRAERTAPEIFSRRVRVLRPDREAVWADERFTMIPEPGAYGASEEQAVSLVELFDVTAAELEALHQNERARFVAMVARVSAAAMAGLPTQLLYQSVVEAIGSVFEAVHVVLAIPQSEHRYEIVAAVGPLADALGDGCLPVDQAFIERVAAGQQASRIAPPADAARLMPGGPGPLAGARFRVHGGDGAISVMRPPGARDFDDVELAMITQIAEQLTMALALGAERVDRQRLIDLEDRQRLIQELHDRTIQTLVASGMLLEAQADASHEETSVLRLVVDQLNDTVMGLREVVFDLALLRALQDLNDPGRPGGAGPAD